MQNKKNPLLLILLVIVLTVVGNWYSPMAQLAGGEEGFTVFNHQSIISQIYPWQKVGTGAPLPFYITKAVPVLLNKLLLGAGLELYKSQMIFMFLMLSSGVLGMFFLARHLFSSHSDQDGISFLSALFYLFNLFTLSQVFNRLILAGIFLWAYLPIWLYLWDKLLIDPKVKKWLIFLGSSLLYSMVFHHLANILTLWTVAGVWAVARIIQNRSRFRLIAITSLFALLMWLLVNLWFVVPYVSLVSQATQAVQGQAYNLDQLSGLSTFYKNDQVLTLRQKHVFGPNSHLFSFYSHSAIKIISLVILAVMLFGFWKTKLSAYKFPLTLLAVLGWYISKGTNFPGGYTFFKVLLYVFPPAQVWRNSYEKFGLVWVLTYSIFFASGVFLIAKRLKPSLAKLWIIGISVVSFGLLSWPLWTGRLFSDSQFVHIPEYFFSANNYLSSLPEKGRILMLPLHQNDSVRFKWGYIGTEPSEFLFDLPTVSRPSGNPTFDKKYKTLYEAFVSGGDYSSILDEMGIKFIVIRNDIDLTWEKASSSAQVKQILEANSRVVPLKAFGELEIYKYESPEDPQIRLIGGGSVRASVENSGYLKYIVHISEASEPFTLVLKNTHNPHWQAIIDGKNISKNSLSLGYANGWDVTKLGNYEINIVFKI